ncbi:MAG: DUF4287 domain-containing protein [Phycisphaerales bacterium]|nr:DUF4287 domain-containing protein [Phycisphaerales bacterium]
MKDSSAAEAAMVKNSEQKTGKPLDHWLKTAAAHGAAKHGEIVAFLKTDHGLGHGYANLVAHRLLKSSASDSDADELIAAQYAGKKAGLRPIYDALIARIEQLGDDVELAPKKAYVSVRRAKQFALIQPSTATRLDVGINLKGTEPSERLEASGSFNSMVSHRVRLGSVGDVDKALIEWLRAAYNAAG